MIRRISLILLIGCLCIQPIHAQPVRYPEEAIVTMSQQEQYEANLFLSNFSEQGFKDYDPSEINVGQIVSYAHLYDKINYHQGIGYQSGYETMNIDHVNVILKRFLDVELSEKQASTFQTEHAYYENGTFYFQAADGQAHNMLTIVDTLKKDKDGIYHFDFYIYELDINTYWDNNGWIDDHYYYLTNKEARKTKELKKIGSGTAAGIPSEYYGHHTYKLLMYKLDRSKG